VGEYDLIGGLAGLGVYALERLPRPTARVLLERVVDRLAELAEEMEEGSAWFTPPERLPEWQRELHSRGNYNLGVAHGLPGVVPVLAGACAAGVAVERARPLLESSVKWLLARRLPAGAGSCFAGSYAPWEDPSPTRLAWCYGDLGIAASLLVAARAVGEAAWEGEAIAIARGCAARAQEASGVIDAGICHGAAGAAHLFNRLYQATGDPAFRDAAVAWIEQVLAYRQPGKGVGGFEMWVVGEGEELAWRSDPGFLTGSAGVGLALLAAATPVEPEWDRILLADMAERR
jgi:hypothetical protein